MKKKVVAVIMAAMMVMSMAACGSNDSGESISTDNSIVQGGTEKSGTGESVPTDDSTVQGSAENSGSDAPDASDERETEESDASGDSGAGEAGAEDGQPSEDDSRHVLNVENLPDNYDWASVDWDRIVMTRVIDTGDGNTFEEYTYAWELVGYAIERRYDYAYDEYLYSELDEESKTIIEKLLELSKKDLTSIYVALYPIPDNYDWTSVDWRREIGTWTSEWDNPPVRATYLLKIVGSVWRYNLFPELNQNPNEEKKTAEELMNEYLSNTSIGTYDSLDEESKMLVDKLLDVESDFEIMLNLEKYVEYISWLE